MLSMKGISKIYRTDTVETHALRQFSLAVDEGEFVSVTGPSGSGKTTFLNIAGLLEESSGGAYELDGRDVAGLNDAEVSRIGRTGIPLGIAFQIQDDILNLESEAANYGKDHCGDLTEGKHTLILTHALRSASTHQRDEAIQILGKPNSSKRHDEIRFLLDLIENHRSIEYARAVASRHTRKFAGMLHSIVRDWPSSEHRNFLLDLSDYTIQRAA